MVIPDNTDAVLELMTKFNQQARFLEEAQAELQMLRKIAAHVPATLWIKAKEDAGFPEVIKMASPIVLPTEGKEDLPPTPTP